MKIKLLLLLFILALFLGCGTQKTIIESKNLRYEKILLNSILDSNEVKIYNLQIQDSLNSVVFDSLLLVKSDKYVDSIVVKKDTTYYIETIIDTTTLPYEASFLKRPDYGNTSIQFYDLNQDKSLLSYNQHHKLLPASNLKIATVAAALLVLGSDFQFTTDFYYSGKVEKKSKTLKGNIYVKGSGDPTLGRDYFREKEYDKFYDVAKYLKDTLRVNKINGDVYVLNRQNYFKFFGKGWDADDLSFYYAPIISPVSFNENLIRLKSRKGTITQIPDYPFTFTLDTVSNIWGKFYRVIGTDSVIVRSNFRRTFYGYVTVNDPEKLFISEFKKHLSDKKIKFNNKSYKKGKLEKFYTLKSDSLWFISEKCNKESNNFYAEQLFRKVAAKGYLANLSDSDSLSFDSFPGEDELTQKDILKLNESLYENLFGISDFKLADGSGLSRQNFLSSADFVNVLKTMYKSPQFSTYLSTFPQPAMKDASLENKFIKDTFSGKVFAKTGSLTGVHCLSGYLMTNSGKQVAFSILSNNYTVSRGKLQRKFEELVEAVILHY